MTDIRQDLAISGDTVTGAVRGIPAGSGRLFTLNGYDAAGDLIYTGSTRVDMAAGELVTVRITMKRVSTEPGEPGETITVDLPGGATMEFVWIEPGTFMMGSPTSEEGRDDFEGPQHEVTISRGFWLGKYELTKAQWEAVMGTSPWVGQNYVQANPNHPAVYISWNDMQEFIQRLNDAAGEELYRFPTEAEWEYACRAGTTTRWSFGDDESRLGEYAWYDGNNSPFGTKEVGTKLPNPWGLYDMHGNVFEWVQDWWGEYTSDSQTDPTGPASGAARVVQGGDFGSLARSVRSAGRSISSPSSRDYLIGARLLRMVEPVPLPEPDPGQDQAEITVTTPAGTTHEMVLVPAGEFIMGSNDGGDDEKPVHTVYLDGFYIDQYEVTNAQFQAFVEATGHQTTAEFEGLSWGYTTEWEEVAGARWNAPQGPGSDLTGLMDHPVVHVSWFDAEAYCEWVGLQLPTEAEWEKAARGTDGQTYPWGEEIDHSKANYGTSITPDDSDGYSFTSPVGSYPGGVSPYGVYDMAGNVWDWVADWHDSGYYSRSPAQNPTGPESGSNRVLRGGSWFDDPIYLRSSYRHWFTSPSNTLPHIGFRCAQDQ